MHVVNSLFSGKEWGKDKEAKQKERCSAVCRVVVSKAHGGDNFYKGILLSPVILFGLCQRPILGHYQSSRAGLGVVVVADFTKHRQEADKTIRSFCSLD